MESLKIEQLQSLQSKDQAALLDTIDEIRRYGVGRYVDLPQLVVCGDQSSGKSSVLEAISGVQFPVNDGLCTRFTTEVILRRATKSLATVKLKPSEDATSSHKEKLSHFVKSSLDHAEIPDLISEAKSFMGLTGSSTFSRDVLQLEVSGPKMPHLTLVDLPGLIHNPNKEQTKEDVRIPTELVQKYMSQSLSIVLAIVTAKNDTSNQVVLTMAKMYDPQGNRTMGIITKPDCLIEDSPNEASFFSLASNKETPFKLDWHVLRNGDFNERKDPSFDRDAAEKEFFEATIWRNLPSHKRGIEALRSRLSHVLYQQIRTTLPRILGEIEKELKNCQEKLDKFGSSRDTPGSRRRYLTDISGRFQDLVRAGSHANYQNSFFRQGTLDTVQMQQNRLRANVRKAGQIFLDKMHQRGHTYVILSEAEITKLQSAKQEVDNDDQIFTSEEDFLENIRDLLDSSKGKELPGTFSPLLVGDLFLSQSENWKPFADDFVENVWNIAKQFLDDVLIHVADEQTREVLVEDIIDPAMENILKKLRQKVTELHSPYASGSTATLNPRFVKELEARRSQHAEKLALKPAGVPGAATSEDADMYACRELLHLMQAYYTVALDVFVDNVWSLAVENCLMDALENLFSPEIVSEMNDEELQKIASESAEVRLQRSQELEKQTSLQKSLELCRRQARMIASNRLKEEAQHKESSPTGLAYGLAKMKISSAASTATPKKSEAPNTTNAKMNGHMPSASLGSGASTINGQIPAQRPLPSGGFSGFSSNIRQDAATTSANNPFGIPPSSRTESFLEAATKGVGISGHSNSAFGSSPGTFGFRGGASRQSTPSLFGESKIGGLFGSAEGAQGQSAPSLSSGTNTGGLFSNPLGKAQTQSNPYTFSKPMYIATSTGEVFDSRKGDQRQSTPSLFSETNTGGLFTNSLWGAQAQSTATSQSNSLFGDKPTGQTVNSPGSAQVKTSQATSVGGTPKQSNPTSLFGATPRETVSSPEGAQSTSKAKSASQTPAAVTGDAAQSQLANNLMNSEKVDCDYLKGIPSSIEIVPWAKYARDGYLVVKEPGSTFGSTFENVYHHIAMGKIAQEKYCPYSTEELRLKDYQIMELPKQVPAK